MDHKINDQNLEDLGKIKKIIDEIKGIVINSKKEVKGQEFTDEQRDLITKKIDLANEILKNVSKRIGK